MNSVIVPYDANRQELIAKIGGAVHAVGGPPARLERAGKQFPVNALSDIGDIVKSAGESTSEWTVSDGPSSVAVPLTNVEEKARKRSVPAPEAAQAATGDTIDDRVKANESEK